MNRCGVVGRSKMVQATVAGALVKIGENAFFHIHVFQVFPYAHEYLLHNIFCNVLPLHHFVGKHYQLLIMIFEAVFKLTLSQGEMNLGEYSSEI
jgi:hypothetical protein